MLKKVDKTGLKRNSFGMKKLLAQGTKK